jgi:2-polyprenyl-3-methyl-5-hydroxy-6-metoxy-1,4-benzoquinol methylase
MARPAKPELPNDGERMVPELHKGMLLYAEHFIRYQAALPIIKDKIVLDIASGSGYGTQLMATAAKHVYGVDVSQSAIDYAQANYSAQNVSYKFGDGENIPLEDASVDVVITFETIEHVKDYKAFIREIKRVLKPDGIAIVSTPNDLEFAEGNHFHLHEFKYKELHTLLEKDFTYIDDYFQVTSKYVALGGQEIFDREDHRPIETLNLAPRQPKEYLYFYLVCSNKKIPTTLQPLAAIGEHYSDRQNFDAYQQQRSVSVEYQQLKDVHRDIVDKLTAVTNHCRNLEQEIKNIKDSKAYHAGLRLSKLKQKIKL